MLTNKALTLSQGVEMAYEGMDAFVLLPITGDGQTINARLLHEELEALGYEPLDDDLAEQCLSDDGRVKLYLLDLADEDEEGAA